ncbi:MAG: 1-acyl-sn-glycerol-3-phosphate acyltransferase [Thermoanaerobaculia bacterium]|nr:1-acyl-sn-glycerol-3-phosphate acyltransferase [Thermoanaerobaculia bacterium]
MALLSLFSASVTFGFKPLRRPAPDLYYPVRNWAYRAWTTGLCWAWNIHLEIDGDPPTGDYFLVTNHLSYIDIPVLARKLHGTFIAKSELSGWPVAGQIIRSGDTIFIDRGRKRDLLRVMEEVDRTLGDGLGVILFPEGTSSSGESMLPFKPSLLQIAAGSHRPVHWATLEYRTEDAERLPSRFVNWWGDEGFVPHYLRFVTLDRITAVIRFGPDPVHGRDRKELSAALRERMMDAFRPMK